MIKSVVPDLNLAFLTFAAIEHMCLSIVFGLQDVVTILNLYWFWLLYLDLPCPNHLTFIKEGLTYRWVYLCLLVSCSLDLHHEIEELKAKVSESNNRMIQMEADFADNQRLLELENSRIQDELAKLRDRYDRWLLLVICLLFHRPLCIRICIVMINVKWFKIKTSQMSQGTNLRKWSEITCRMKILLFSLNQIHETKSLLHPKNNFYEENCDLVC